MQPRLLLRWCIVFAFASTVSAQNFKTLAPLWSLKPGDRPYLTGTSATGANDNLQRGIGYNPVTDHLLLVSRWTNEAVSGSSLIQGIYILDGNTGGELGTLNTNGINAGALPTFLLLKINVAEDGVIYGANFGTFNPANPNTNFKLYRWADESAAPTVAFNGDPSGGTTNLQWGTTLEVRGSGANTEILLGSNGKVASLLRTSDGLTFTPIALLSDVPNPGDFEHGIGFDSDNSFWGKRAGSDLRKFVYGAGTGNAVTISTYDTNALATSSALGQLAVDANNHLLAFLETPLPPPFSGTGVLPRQNRVRLYDISNSSIAPVLLDIENFPTNWINRLAAGAVDFGNGKLFALSANNGLMAFTVTPTASVVPEVVTAPNAQRVLTGASLSFSVLAKYATSYQWRRGVTDIPGATNPVLNLTNVQGADAGTYTVVMGNSAGTSSASAQLTVVPPASVPRLSPVWSYVVRNVTPPLTFSTDANTPFNRSLTYHSLSNQVLYIDRTSATANLTVNVLDADSGAFLYRLRTTGITQGAIVLLMIAASDDGSVYAANMQADARIGGASVGWKLYRWANTGTNTDPVLIFQGDPADLFAPDFPATRWGDSMDVRGSGINTEIILDAWDHEYGSVFSPNGADLNITWNHTGFLQSYFGGSIGRSLQFGSGNTFWQKRKASPLQWSSYDLATQTSTPLNSYDVFPDSTGPVTMHFPSNLLASIDFATTTASPDMLSLYEISDLTTPLLLGSYPFPTNRQGNNNFIGQIVFGGGKVFAVDGNNGIMGLEIQSGSVMNPPVVLTQPRGFRAVAGQGGALSVVATDVGTYQWQKDGTNIAGATTNTLSFGSLQLSDAGTYRVVLSNSVGVTISSNAVVIVESPDDFHTLSQIWSLAPNSRPYLPLDGDAQGRTPLYRSIAYNALSNHVYIVSRTGPSAGLTINVLDASTGADLYQLNTNGIADGAIVLLGIAVADDGAIYAANMDAGGVAGPATYKLYRWADSDPATVPVNVFSGEPANLAAPVRWGDTLAVRGSGINTEVLIDSNQGLNGALLKPVDSSMTLFTNSPFTASYPQPPIGRSLQFGSGNTFWQKRSGNSLRLSSYNLAGQSSTLLSNFTAFPNSVGPVALDASRNLLAGIIFAGGTAIPDSVGLADITDLSEPLFLAKYNFPTNSRPNGNLIGQVIFAGTNVYAVDGNNGIVAFTILPPGFSATLTLRIERSGSDVILSWTDPNAILQATPSLTPINWSDISTPGQTSKVESAATGMKFYQLRK